MFKLYVIVDRGVFTSDHDWLSALSGVAEACKERPEIGIQVRIKEGTAQQRDMLLMTALTVLRARGTEAFLNGSTAEARKTGFSGVHWPEALIPQAPQPSPGLPAGASVHSTAATARAAAAGASFLVFGSVFDAGSKPVTGVGVEELQEVTSSTTLPVLAIGGITPGRVEECLRAGAAGVAVVTGILHASDPAAAMAEYLTAIEHARAENVRPVPRSPHT